MSRTRGEGRTRVPRKGSLLVPTSPVLAGEFCVPLAPFYWETVGACSPADTKCRRQRTAASLLCTVGKQSTLCSGRAGAETDSQKPGSAEENGGRDTSGARRAPWAVWPSTIGRASDEAFAIRNYCSKSDRRMVDDVESRDVEIDGRRPRCELNLSELQLETG